MTRANIQTRTAGDLMKSAALMIGPPPTLTVSQWADANRILSREAASEPGRWQTDRAPFQRGIMDAMSEPGISVVVVQSCSQVGKTEILLNGIGYFIDQDPAPILAIEPTLQMGEALSKDRVAPMVRDTPVLTGKVRPVRSKDSDNTLLHKGFPGGHLTICGANSAASLAMRPIRVIFADEIDRYPVSAGAEGDPLKLASKRSATFHNRLTVMVSTPTVKGASRIEQAFLASDQRRFYCPCPHCGLYQPLLWKNLKWGKKADGHGWDGLDPWIDCDGCGAAIPEQARTKMLRAGVWTAEAFAAGVAGFHLSELYSPWVRWRDLVAAHYEALGDTELRRVFVNTCLGETFEETGEGVDAGDLIGRRETYAAPVPDGGVVLTAGVDVQDDRLEIQVRAWGHGEESWRVAYRVLYGDPAQPEIWEALDDIILSGSFVHESGNRLSVAATCIDSGGHYTKAVYAYVKERASRRVFATVGRAGFGRPMVSAPSRRKMGRDRRPVDLFVVGVDEIKSLEQSRLRRQDPGPGFCHFPESDDFGPEYFAQLTAEDLHTSFYMGVPKRVWKKKRVRNEALDCSVLDYAALFLLKPNFDALARRLDSPAATDGGDKTGGPAGRGTLPRVKRGGFVNSWKG